MFLPDLVQLAGDLREVLKLRQENIYKEKGNPPGMARWAANSEPLWGTDSCR